MGFADKLLDWYDHHGRHDLPWQVHGDPYPVWISEIMLQQTQVTTVIPYFERFMDQFPVLQHLADADLDHVLHLWSGLGYYARARNMHKTARLIADECNGQFPLILSELVSLPGIGRSTAGAILAQSMGQRHPILDGNVKRVLARHYCIGGWTGHRQTENRLWQLSEQNTPHYKVADYTQAIMDLGATICKRSNPDCPQCPLRDDCQAFLSNVVNAYPQKREKKVLPVKSTTFLLIKNDSGDIFLTQKPPTGIWGGLWCLPELGEYEEKLSGLMPTVAGTASNNTMPVIRHTFSHYHLDFTVIPVKLEGHHATGIMESTSTVWYNPDRPSQLGLAAPIKKIIHNIEV